MDFSLFYNKIHHLPLSVQKQIMEYIDGLLAKTPPKKRKRTKPTFSWEGGLSGMKKKYTSVELQHFANQLR